MGNFRGDAMASVMGVSSGSDQSQVSDSACHSASVGTRQPVGQGLLTIGSAFHLLLHSFDILLT